MAQQKEDAANEKGNESFFVIVTFEVKEDKVEAFKALAKPVLVENNKEKGCIRYNIHQDKRDPAKFVSLSEWQTQQDFENHMKAEHVKTFNQESVKQGIAKGPFSVFHCGPGLLKLE
eukprot:CAMPEP_0197048072 /NCGR_PEP_ID=MMETSP1384-20130603/23479_1 /TAXON_ID=29189 /ORGANISM="Ammonia sp." /LENGTH=116 /DNA_ID=CAMNT_0042480127 /DNA_START=97 /DNA_END=447 /DNA_ORIENTATION=-